MDRAVSLGSADGGVAWRSPATNRRGEARPAAIRSRPSAGHATRTAPGSGGVQPSGFL